MAKCAYFGLTGIIVDRTPSKEFIKKFAAENLAKIAAHYCSSSSGVATAFWGLKYLDYSKIVSLEKCVSYAPVFKKENGLFVPQMPLCNEKDAGNLSSNERRTAAMREILMQALDLLEGEREGRYFMLTTFEKGCCNFQGGKIMAKLDDIVKLI
ncbi:MAG: hypothetical protein PHO02_03785 [Candidatus Nanoarchaeia archaeon]|nr:hypothetical protein [Candidatus Nanoarchaeia archaeon]